MAPLPPLLLLAYYHWWQYLIVRVLLPTLALFSLSFGASLDLLKKQMISTNTFLISSVVPLVALWFYVKSKRHRLSPQEYNEEEEACVNEILDQEETLFIHDDNGMRWPVVQLYRNFLVVIINTFILDNVFKSLWFTVLFVAFYVHDMDRMPFKHPYLNHLQRLTSVCLFLVNICSVPSSFSSVGNNLAVPNMKICLKVLRYFERCLYFIVPLSLPLWEVSTRCRKRLHKSKKDR